MNLLNKYNQNLLFHVSPLHYLVFILRSMKLFSKRKLLEKGYTNKHFRTTSKNCDVKRGFIDFVHCSNKEYAPILKSKLSLGYPHIEYVFPSCVLPEDSYLLCRYNIAKNRGLFNESDINGYCYNNFKIPVAKTNLEKNLLLQKYANNNHIEILIKDFIVLPVETTIITYSKKDLQLTKKYLNEFI